MTELAAIARIICVAILISAAINAASETTRLEARRDQMQAEIDHACQPAD